ncbi:hypothetical protein SAMN05443572_10399 [Myxococcus fulvus]|uniref:Uncharacterized protein n=2 Tax=Myxococcus fulvus TaxID=33 RepID=A0ABY1C722_MYXFU|nr:hypothetical protein [Myxococcus fulvus]SET75950.1 hypothetical protein SAMN05443572_10399 [Myxococcus fulvus]
MFRVSGPKTSAVVMESLDRTMNVVALEATAAKSVGNKGASTPVTTPQQVLEKVGSVSGTVGNIASVADTFESGARAVGQLKKGVELTSMPTTVVGKTLGRFVPGLNIATAVASASNAHGVFTNPASTPAQKTHAAIDASTAFVAALPVPFVAQGAAVANTLNSLLTPASK